MGKGNNPGIVLPAVLVVFGFYLIHDSIVQSEWYRDVYLIFGAPIAGLGLVTGCWELQRYRSLRRLGQYVRRFR